MLDFSSNQHDFKCKEYINSWRIGSLKIFCTVAKIVVYYYYYYNDAILFPPTYFLPAVHWWGSHNGEPGPPLRLLDLSPGFIICVGWIFTFLPFWISLCFTCPLPAAVVRIPEHRFVRHEMAKQEHSTFIFALVRISVSHRFQKSCRSDW